MRRTSASGDRRDGWNLSSLFPFLGGSTAKANANGSEQQSSPTANAAAAPSTAAASTSATANVVTNHRSIQIQDWSITPRGGAANTPGTFTDTTMNGENNTDSTATDTAAAAMASSITAYSSPAPREFFHSHGTRTTIHGTTPTPTPSRSILVPPNPQYAAVLSTRPRPTGGIRFMDEPFTEPRDNNTATTDQTGNQTGASSSATQDAQRRRRSDGILRSQNGDRFYCLRGPTVAVSPNDGASQDVAFCFSTKIRRRTCTSRSVPEQHEDDD